MVMFVYNFRLLYRLPIIGVFLTLFSLPLLAHSVTDIHGFSFVSVEKSSTRFQPARLKAEVANFYHQSSEESDAFVYFHAPSILSDKRAVLSIATQEVATAFKGKPDTRFAREVTEEASTNFDFESGTMEGWTGQSGWAQDAPEPMFVSDQFDRHTLVSQGFDELVGTALPKVAPGGAFSLRLEDTTIEGSAASIRRTFRVTEDNANFSYRFALVLEDPFQTHHHLGEKPYFRVDFTDEEGNPLLCGSYRAIAQPPTPDLAMLNKGDRRFYWRSWTTVAVPLAAYIGQNVTIRFTVSDCAQGGHLGYAYIDASILPLQIEAPATDICLEQSSVLVTAPTGFASYYWTGPGIVGNREQATIQARKAGLYQVTLTSIAGLSCQSTLHIELQPGTLEVDSDTTIEEGQSVQLRATGASSYQWSPAEGLDHPTRSHPIATPSRTTTYTVTACGHFVDSVTVYVKKKPIAAIEPRDAVLCPNEVIRLSSQPIPLEYHCAWFRLSGNTWESLATDPSVVVKESGTYSLLVSHVNGYRSADTIQITACAIREDQVALTPVELFVPNIVTPNQDRKNDTWVIQNLEAFGSNTLVIYDRYGTEIYRTENYQHDWDASGLTSNIYYYWIKLEKQSKAVTGWVQVLR